MNENPSCPICGTSVWRLIGTRTYRLSDIDELNEYERKRYRVLFELWFPGHQEIELTSRLCEECGFVYYAPRPSSDDVAAKYCFLKTLDGPETVSPCSPIDHQRARLLFRKLRRHIDASQGMQILDYGGGDGRLMNEFLARGHSCYLVDYSKTACNGITHLGSTELDIPDDVFFNLIIASHVVEHVADPLAVLSKLKKHLKPDGTIYVEVPLEIWGGPPLQREPVTHVNFFTRASMRHLFERAGLDCLSCKMGSYPYHYGQTLLCIRAIGTPGHSNAYLNSATAITETERFLKPDLSLRLKRRMLMPSTIPKAIVYKITQCVEKK